MGSKHGFPVSRKIDMLIRSGNSFSYEKKKFYKKWHRHFVLIERLRGQLTFAKQVGM